MSRPPSPSLTVAIACGGTGGHTYPGLVTARELRRRGHTVELWLAGRDVEAQTACDWDGARFRTGAVPLALRSLPTLLASIVACWRRLALLRPSALLAMGSYASLPPVLAAALRGVPVVLHEANAIPGAAVTRLARLATAVAVSFPETRSRISGCRRVEHTGLPVRPELAGAPPLNGFRQSSGFTLLVTGGSQGAHAVNTCVRDAVVLLARAGRLPGLRVIHQTGVADEASVRAAYAAANVDAQVSAYLRDMGGAYAAADLVIARAGASTCMELCFCGPPPLLIPLPTSARDHQRANAAALVRAGAAEMREQAVLTPAALAQTLLELAADAPRRARLRAALRALAVPDAAARLADLLIPEP